MYYFKYKVVETGDELVIATTRPETLFGDTAVAVNPKDERYKDLIGKNVVLPIVNKLIPIIADEHADPEFGTGVVKITMDLGRDIENCHVVIVEDIIDSVSNVLDESRTTVTSMTVTLGEDNTLTVYCKLAEIEVIFLANGGKVWCSGDLPTRIEGKKADLSWLASTTTFEEIEAAAEVKLNAANREGFRQMIRNTNSGKLVYNPE